MRRVRPNSLRKLFCNVATFICPVIENPAIARSSSMHLSNRVGIRVPQNLGGGGRASEEYGVLGQMRRFLLKESELVRAG